MNPREYRRAGILALELADLPLPSDHPQRVARFGSQRALEIRRARPAFQPVPDRDGREAPRLQRLGHVGDLVAISHPALR
jgi:hypothetical protein